MRISGRNASTPSASQLALVADARQLFQRLRMLAGGVSTPTSALAAQRHHPFAQRAAALTQRCGSSAAWADAGAEQDAPAPTR